MPIIAAGETVLDSVTSRGVLGPEALGPEALELKALEQVPVAPPFSATPLSLAGFLPEPATIEELQLAQRIFFLSGDKVPRVVVFCSVEPGDGSDSVCARMAEVLLGIVSEAVCLIDADLRSPSLHLRYQIDDTLRFHPPNGKVEQEPARMHQLGLSVLPAAALKDAQPGFSPDRFRAHFTNLRKKFGFLLICAPPLGSAAEGYLLGQMADGVVVTVLARNTQRALAQKVRRNLELYNVRLLGAVIHERSRKRA